MSIAQLTNPSTFCSSPTLSRSPPPPLKQNPFLPFLSKHLSSKNLSFSDAPIRFSGAHRGKPLISAVRASSAPASESQPSNSESEGGGEYEVELEKPYGLKFAKGRDGGTYIDSIFPDGAADKSGKFSVGDKVIATRQLEDSGELSEKEIIRAERNSGVISNRVREIQSKPYTHVHHLSVTCTVAICVTATSTLPDGPPCLPRTKLTGCKYHYVCSARSLMNRLDILRCVSHCPPRASKRFARVVCFAPNDPLSRDVTPCDPFIAIAWITVSKIRIKGLLISGWLCPDPDIYLTYVNPNRNRAFVCHRFVQCGSAVSPLPSSPVSLLPPPVGAHLLPSAPTSPIISRRLPPPRLCPSASASISSRWAFRPANLVFGDDIYLPATRSGILLPQSTLTFSLCFFFFRLLRLPLSGGGVGGVGVGVGHELPAAVDGMVLEALSVKGFGGWRGRWKVLVVVALESAMQNYMRKMEQKQSREKDLREGLILYRGGKYEEAREKFESVLGSKPEPTEASVASYNVACCYSKLNQVQAGLSALEDALEAGYEDFKATHVLLYAQVEQDEQKDDPAILGTIRTDPDLANLRASEEFEPLMKRFDESFINENAINAIKSLFGIFNKK
ncbi:hypothetical protein ACLOJK_005775 [Asimina triloba]